MATNLSSSSRFSYLQITWNPDGYISRISFRTTTDTNETSLPFPKPKDYVDLADDHHLTILREIYESDDGFLDADGNTFPIVIQNFSFSDTATVEDFSMYGGFNPFIEAEFDAWLEGLHARSFFVGDGDYSEDSETGRPRIEESIDRVPTHRNPGTDTYEFALGEYWQATVVGTDIIFRRLYTDADNVLPTNIDEDFSMLAFLDWLEGLRTSGDEVGTDPTATATYNSREFAFDQAGDAAVLDLEFVSIGTSRRDGGTGNYSSFSLTFRRVSGETDTIEEDAVRTTLNEATGTLDSSDEDMLPEAPVRGSIQVAYEAERVKFPDGIELEVLGDGLAIRHPSRGLLALDGSSVRAVKFADLDDISGVTGGKWMPNDGSSVIHFGHSESANGFLRYRALEDMVTTDGEARIHYIHNVSDLQNLFIQNPDASTFSRIRPYQKSGPMLVTLEGGGHQGEIIALNPPDKHLLLRRGIALPNFGDTTRYAQSEDSGAHYFQSLGWPDAAVQFSDSDVFIVNNESDPSNTHLNSTGEWDIRGSFGIERDGWINIYIRYVLYIDPPAGESASGELNAGNGVSLWRRDPEDNALTFVFRAGELALGGLGAEQAYSLVYRNRHVAGTQFCFLHRIPIGSSMDLADYAQVKQRDLQLEVTLEPELRTVVSS